MQPVDLPLRPGPIPFHGVLGERLVLGELCFWIEFFHQRIELLLGRDIRHALGIRLEQHDPALAHRQHPGQAVQQRHIILVCRSHLHQINRHPPMQVLRTRALEQRMRLHRDQIRIDSDRLRLQAPAEERIGQQLLGGVKRQQLPALLQERRHRFALSLQ